MNLNQGPGFGFLHTDALLCFTPTHCWTAKSSSGSSRASELGSPLDRGLKDSAPVGIQRQSLYRTVHLHQTANGLTYSQMQVCKV